MHTTIVELSTGGTYRVHHNGDWSGDVTIVVGKGDVDLAYITSDTVEVEFPFEVMLECVGQYIIDQRIANLVGMTGRKFVDILRKQF